MGVCCIQYTYRKSEEDTPTLQECLTRTMNLLSMHRHNAYITIYTALVIITIVIQIHSIIIHIIVTVILFTLIISMTFIVVVYWAVCMLQLFYNTCNRTCISITCMST